MESIGQQCKMFGLVQRHAGKIGVELVRQLWVIAKTGYDIPST